MWKRRVALALPADVELSRNELAYAVSPKALRPGHRIELLRDGKETYPAMLAAIHAATTFVHLEVYILHSDVAGRQFGAALAERARAGVAVRLLYDAVGSLGMASDFLEDMEKAGVQLRAFGPIAPWNRRSRWNRRDHRKILVVDGRVGFTGGLNIGDEYVTTAAGGLNWHDLHARVEGPAVTELARLFRRTWIAAGGDDFPQQDDDATEVVATSGTAYALAMGNEEIKRRRSIRVASLHAMRRAKKTIRIMSGYFVPDRGIRRVLINAVNRGVDVCVVVPSHSDLRAVMYAGQHVYSRLLRLGVRIVEWPDFMLHAKVAVVDGVWAMIGSYNLDARSLFHNLEVVLTVVDHGFAGRLGAQIDSDINVGRELHLAEWKQRSVWRKVAEWVCYQFRFWL